MRRITTTISILIIVLTFISGCSNTFELEKNNEMADLEGMRGAELTAMSEWKDKLPDETIEYWYDPDSFKLIPVSDPKPESHGLGEAGKGGAVEEFEKNNDVSYEYDEGMDYTDKVVHVTVSNKDGKLDIKVDWVDAE